jgi:hypothetical protein
MTSNSENQTKKAYRRCLERVTLSTAAYEKAASWIAELTKERPGIKISVRDFVNFLVLSKKELVPEEKAELGALYYDEVRFLSQALKALKGARSRGEKVALGDLLTGIYDPTVSPAKRKRKPKDKPRAPEDISQPQSEPLTPDQPSE